MDGGIGMQSSLVLGAGTAGAAAGSSEGHHRKTSTLLLPSTSGFLGGGNTHTLVPDIAPLLQVRTASDFPPLISHSWGVAFQLSGCLVVSLSRCLVVWLSDRLVVWLVSRVYEQQAAAAAGPASGLDVARWDQDDLDLRELLERLEHHHGVIVSAFGDASGVTSKMANDLKTELSAVKRMVTVVSQVIVADGNPQSVLPKLQVPRIAAVFSCACWLYPPCVCRARTRN